MKDNYGPLYYLVPAILVLALMYFNSENLLTSIIVLICAIGLSVSAVLGQRKLIRDIDARSRQ